PLGGSHLTAVLTMLAGLGWYGSTLLLPYGPTFDARVALQESLFTLPVAAGVALLALLVYGLVRGTPRTRLACAWFLMALVPVSNVFFPLKIPTADRFLYLPLMGLAFLAAELARRTYPVSAKVMPVVLVLLGLLTVARIGDWRDDAALIGAGVRVHPKSRMLLWAEAGLEAKRAVHLLDAGDPAGRLHAARAEKLYEQYVKNSQPGEQTRVWVELGDLYFAVGTWQARYDPRGGQRATYSRAMEAYFMARQLQGAGVGRVVEEEVVHTARRLVDLAVKLAEPRNPNLGQTIKAGLEAMDFLKRQHGFDDRLPRAQLRFADSAAIRGRHPEKARQGLDWVLATLDELEREGARHLTYLRAQATFYRAILKDRDDPNRHDMEAAYALYLQAARRTPTIRLQALVYAGRAAGKIGQLFRDEEWRRKGVALLESVPATARAERLLLTAEQQREIDTLLRELR
ncbi:MAG: hypothetical protein ACYTFD_19470, partial [Planctomycetota bacterium]